MNKFNFIYVNKDGSVRELSIVEKLYLNTKYTGSDGDRPYINKDYFEEYGKGYISGYYPRGSIPQTVTIIPNKVSISMEQVKIEIERILNMGYEIDFTGIEDEVLK